MMNIDPKNFDKKMKNTCVNQNIYAAGYGNYKACPNNPTIKFSYIPNAPLPNPTGIANLYVVNKHPIDIVGEITEKGMESLSKTDNIPLVVYPMGREFIGTNYESREGMVDENIVLRTNYAHLLKRSATLFPLKEDTDILYTKIVSVIRDPQYSMLNYPDLYKMSICTIFPPRDISLLEIEEEKSQQILSSKNLITFQMTVESIFQAAICGSHSVLILTMFNQELNIPIDDQILVFNFCILKYAAHFKDIVIGIPPYCGGKELVDYIDQHIVKPQEVTKVVDNLYLEKQLKSTLLKNTNTKNDHNSNSVNEQPLTIPQQQMLNMTPEQKMEVIQKLLKEKKNKKKTK